MLKLTKIIMFQGNDTYIVRGLYKKFIVTV